MRFFKRQLPAIVVFVIGIVLVIQFYIPHPSSQLFLEETNRWQRILKNCALLLGVLSLVAYHWRKIRRRQAGYGYSVTLLVFFGLMVFFGMWKGIDAPRTMRLPITIPADVAQRGGELQAPIEVYPGDQLTFDSDNSGVPFPTSVQGYIASEKGRGATIAIQPNKPIHFDKRGKLTLILPGGGQGESQLKVHLVGQVSAGYWMFQNIKVPLESSMYSLLAFFISSAAFRAFRARSLDATIMLATALFVMIGRISFGDIVSSWIAKSLGTSFLFFPDGTAWLMNVPAMAARRAVSLGIALSIIATATRIIFGIERSYLGKGE